MPPRKGYKQTPEHAAKTRAAARVANLGNRHSSETKAQMSASQVRRHQDPEEREKRRTETLRRYEDPAERGRSARRMAGNSYLREAKVIGVCVYCGDPATTYDHVIPRGRLGGRSMFNTVPACLPCNASKGNRDPEEWAEALEARIEVARLVIKLSERRLAGIRSDAWD